MSQVNLYPDSPIEYLKGVGPAKAAILKTQLNIHTPGELLQYFPYRYIDKSKISDIADLITEGQFYQVKGILRWIDEKAYGKSKRLIANLDDHSGSLELIWFQNYKWIKEKLVSGKEYILYGKLSLSGYQKTMAHPEMELYDEAKKEIRLRWDPMYSSNEKLGKKGLDSRGIRRMMFQAFQSIDKSHFKETLPNYVIQKFKLPDRYTCLANIHFPENEKALETARQRLKFEELFFIQLRMLQARLYRKRKSKGYKIASTGELFDTFYKNHLPFALTNAQKRVVREIHDDLKSGRQMNRLLQGDVGSGKTIVALLIMLMANANGFQCCLMAPTEVLAQQHYNTITNYINSLHLKCALLTSTIKGKERIKILEELKNNKIQILIGTHAVLEDAVQFHHLGLAIIDEQHRFGVEQRARLWAKSRELAPHILVMTATPIPRTLAMSIYGDLDISVIDELPPNRKSIKTLHFTEALRGKLFQFMAEEIGKGRQVYIVYPLIEESEKLDLENLELGYEKLLEYFPIPKYQISVVHGKLKNKDKESEMDRFVRGITQIMVATTVIEVGVNVPNASIMVIESAERFGLSQLHQLRGRVGRGAEQSYCILMTNDHLGREAKSRIRILCETLDGFVIAEEDLKIRGPGDLEGTQQSGLLNLKIADLTTDYKILNVARRLAEAILIKDPDLESPHNVLLKNQLDRVNQAIKLGKIS